MSFGMDDVGRLGSALNKTVNASETLTKQDSTALQQTSALVNLASATGNVLAAIKNVPIVQGMNAILNVENLEIQTQVLNQALADGNIEQIIESSLTFGASRYTQLIMH